MPQQLVVDGGFTTRETILAMEARGIDFFGALLSSEGRAAAQLKRRGVTPEFWPQAFVYDAAGDRYTCPAGKTLRYAGKEKAGRGKTLHAYRAAAADCAGARASRGAVRASPRGGRSVVRKTIRASRPS